MPSRPALTLPLLTLPLLLAAGCTPSKTDSDSAVDTSTCDFSIDPCDANAAWITTCDAYPSIQGALDAARNGTTVHVCAGEHAESLHLSADDHPISTSTSTERARESPQFAPRPSTPPRTARQCARAWCSTMTGWSWTSPG